MFKGVHALHQKKKSDIMRMELLGTVAYQIRSPHAAAAVQRAPSSLISKTTPGFSRVEDWLGKTLFNEDDGAKHADLREVLAPAFSAASTRALVPEFERVGDELAEALVALGGGWCADDDDADEDGRAASVSSSSSEAGAADVEQLCRRATMDAIGRAAFGYDFGAVAAAMPSSAQQQQQAGNGGSSGAAEMRDILDVWDRLLKTAMLLSFNLPLPDALVPGWRDYRASVARLNAIVDVILQRAEQEEQEEDGGSNNATSNNNNNTQSLLSALLRARRERPQLYPTQTVRDTLMLFLFAGSDTTASLLAFLFFELSRRPEALRRCALEARAAVAEAETQQEGQQHPYTPARLPYLCACLSETLRLYPPASDTARVAAADLELGGFYVPKGSLLLLNNYAIHRHERYWPRAEEWLPERWLAEDDEGDEGEGGGEAVGGGETSTGQGNKKPSKLAATDADAYQPFGVGGRACIGRFFALLEAQVLASRVLTAVELSAAGDEPLALAQKFTLSSERGCFVRARRRRPAAASQGGGVEGEAVAAR
jgi:cytochrome P450